MLNLFSVENRSKITNEPKNREKGEVEEPSKEDVFSYDRSFSSPQTDRNSTLFSKERKSEHAIRQ